MLNLKAIVDLVVGTVTRGREAEREITRMTGEATEEGVIRGMTAGTKKAQEKLYKTYAQLGKVGMTEAAKTLRYEVDRANKDQLETQKKISDIRKKLKKTDKEEEKEILRMQEDSLKFQLAAQHEAQEKLIDRAMGATKDRVALMEAAQKRMDRTQDQVWKDRSDGFQKSIQSALSMDRLDPSNIAEGLMKGLSGVMDAKAGKMMASGAGGTAAGAAGIAKLTAAAGTLAAAAGGLAAFLAVLGAAYGQTKDLNKALMEGVSAADMYGAGAVSLGATLGDLRKVSIGLAGDYRLTKEEVLGAITAFNEAGVTLGEMRGMVTETTIDMAKYKTITEMAIRATQTLGLSFSDVADFTNKMNRDLGAGLDSVQGAFGMIAEEAGKAGMNTKDFFAAINNATSGMALYNFRVGDTVGLFSDLVKILGEDLAKEKIGLEGTFRGMGMQERFKSQMLMGRGRASGIVRADAESQGEAFADKFAGKLSGDPAFKGLFSADGRSMDIEALSKMTGEEFRAAYASAQKADPAAARQLFSLRGLAQGATGGGMAAAGALGHLSKTGELAAQLAQGAAFRGGGETPLAELTGVNRMMMEEVTGLTGEAFDQLALLETGLRAEYEAKGGKEVLGDFYDALAAGELSGGAELEALGELKFSTMERIAKEQLEETRSFSQELSNVIAGLLEQIASGMEMLVGIMGDDEHSKKIEARRASVGESQRIGDEIAVLDEKLSELKQKQVTSADGEEVAALGKEISRLQGQRSGLSAQGDAQSRFQRNLSLGMTAQEAMEATFSDEQKSMVDYGESTYATRTTKRMGEMHTETYATSSPEFDKDRMTPEKISEMASGITDAEQEQKLRDEEQLKLQEKQLKEEKKGFDAVVESVENAQKREALAELGSQFGYKAVQTAHQTGDWTSVVANARKGGLTMEESQALALGGASTDLLYNPMANDFIYRGDGRSGNITPINKSDEFFGAKPGGPISQGMGNKSVTININGGDINKVKEVVTKVLLDTGYPSMKSYG